MKIPNSNKQNSKTHDNFVISISIIKSKFRKSSVGTEYIVGMDFNPSFEM